VSNVGFQTGDVKSSSSATIYQLVIVKHICIYVTASRGFYIMTIRIL